MNITVSVGDIDQCLTDSHKLSISALARETAASYASHNVAACHITNSLLHRAPCHGGLDMDITKSARASACARVGRIGRSSDQSILSLCYACVRINTSFDGPPHVTSETNILPPVTGKK